MQHERGCASWPSTVCNKQRMEGGVYWTFEVVLLVGKRDNSPELGMLVRASLLYLVELRSDNLW